MTHTDPLIPTAVERAARRGFIRTTYQALATSIPTAGVTGAVLSSADPVVIAWSLGAAVLSSVGAGVVSYLSMVAKGIPEDYTA